MRVEQRPAVEWVLILTDRERKDVVRALRGYAESLGNGDNANSVSNLLAAAIEKVAGDTASAGVIQ